MALPMRSSNAAGCVSSFCTSDASSLEGTLSCGYDIGSSSELDARRLSMRSETLLCWFPRKKGETPKAQTARDLGSINTKLHFLSLCLTRWSASSDMAAQAEPTRSSSKKHRKEKRELFLTPHLSS